MRSMQLKVSLEHLFNNNSPQTRTKALFQLTLRLIFRSFKIMTRSLHYKSNPQPTRLVTSKQTIDEGHAEVNTLHSPSPQPPWLPPPLLLCPLCLRMKAVEYRTHPSCSCPPRGMCCCGASLLHPPGAHCRRCLTTLRCSEGRGERGEGRWGPAPALLPGARAGPPGRASRDLNPRRRNRPRSRHSSGG